MIKDKQFINCAFERVVIPDTVRKIGNYAFSNCKDLREVVIADGSRLETIESYCFSGCEIAIFTAPASLRTIEPHAFEECKNLQWVSLNEGLETIDWCCFARSSLERINLPDSLKRLYSNAFYECDRLKTVELSTGTIDLSDEEYRTFTLSPDVSEISYHAAFSSLGVRKLIFPDNCRLEKISAFAFARTDIESFVAPPSLREIGQMAFFNCENLEHVELNAQIEKVGTWCFVGTKAGSVQLEPRSSVYLGLQTTTGAIYTLTLPNGMTEIRESLFAYCTFKRVVIPDTVRSICKEAFNRCLNLQTVLLSPNS